VPKVTDLGENSSGIRVNSVGTIIAVIPKPKPTPKPEATETAKAEEKTEQVAKTDEEKVDKQETAETKTEDKPAESKTAETVDAKVKEPANRATKRATPKARPQKPKPVETSPEQTANKTASADDKAKGESVEPDKKNESAENEARSKPRVVVTDSLPKSDASTKVEPPAAKRNPLANVNLVILFKDGRKVERPMTQVLRFTADQTTLTVISTNGRVTKFSILEVASVTIQ
jgi:hypothetical protein